MPNYHPFLLAALAMALCTPSVAALPAQDATGTVGIDQGGDFVVSGRIELPPAVTPGSDGPSIHFRVTGTLLVSAGTVLRAGDGAAGTRSSEVPLAQGGEGGDGGGIFLSARVI